MKTIVPNWNVPPHIQAFTTTREGGVSLPPFDSFNLGDHVEDDKSAVKTNRTLLVEKFNLPHFPLFLTQTHSTRVITVPYEGNNFEADAVYTNQPNQVCLVMTADWKHFTVSSKTPSQSPRQPAWAAATSVPCLLVNKTGRQSAVITKHTWLG